jgi:hypothetical protein
MFGCVHRLPLDNTAQVQANGTRAHPATSMRASVFMLPPRVTIRRGSTLDDPRRRNVNLRTQGAMDGTHLGDLHQPRSLGALEVAVELQCPLHAIEPPAFRFAVRAISRMNPGMRQTNGHTIQRPPFSPRVQRDRHRRSTTKGGQQEIVWRGTGIRATVRDRFVSDQPVRARRDLLGEAQSRSPNDNVRLVGRVVDRHLVARLLCAPWFQLTGFGWAKRTRSAPTVFRLQPAGGTPYSGRAVDLSRLA